MTNRILIVLTVLLVGACGHPKGKTVCDSTVAADPTLAARQSCSFAAGAHVRDTLGITDAQRAAIPITHIVVVTQENRSYDHYFGRLSEAGQPDSEPVPASWSNPDKNDVAVQPFHLESACLEKDPPHQWTAMHAGYDDGKMDGFVASAATAGSDGHFVMGYYDATDLPFYYWLANTYAIGDRYFGATLGGTWANRDFLYSGTSQGVMNTGQAIDTAPNIFDALTAANVDWRVYGDGNPRQDCLGWKLGHKNTLFFQDFVNALGDGTLPPVSFVDPGPGEDEHPNANLHWGEKWGKQIYDAAIKSELWPHLAIIYTYDEGGGLADHVPPPAACVPSPDLGEFNTLGIRIPAIVISPWARSHYVSHVVHEHSSTLRLIELLHDLPALTDRDANSDALLDMFDFTCGPSKSAPEAPASAIGGCQ